MGERVIHQVVRVADLGDRRQFTAKCQLVSLAGQTPYFSVTGEERNLRRRGDNQVEACGCMHEDVLRHWPDLAPLVALHLSDEDGAPMHDVANGWYWAGGTEWNGGGKDRPPNVDYLAKHLRIPAADAERIVADVTGGRMAKAQFAAFVDEQRPRWKAEAEAVAAFLRDGAWPAPDAEEESAPGPRP